jgi:very-short-patch-repair endonuclease
VPKKKDIYYRPYNRKLVPLAKGHRRDPTPAERKLWYEFLQDLRPYFYWQREIGSFITDFYCAPAKLVIEIDGDSHFSEQGRAYDAQRTAYLESLGLRVVRFSNAEVMGNFEGVCTEIRKVLGL